MPFSAVAWPAGSELTSAKLAQMVENLATHDHRFDGTQGGKLARVWSTTVTVAAVANTTTFVTVNYPAGTFDPSGPTPRAIVTPVISGTAVKWWGVDAPGMTSIKVGIHRTNTTSTDLVLVVVQAAA